MAKLPKYEELKRLVQEEHLSYRAISEMYKCNHDSVYQSLKRGARINGDEWPIKYNWKKKLQKGMKDSTIPSAGIAYVVNERIEKEVPRRSPEGIVYVGVRAARAIAPRSNVATHNRNGEYARFTKHKTYWPKRDASFHWPDCRSFTMKHIDLEADAFPIDAEEAMDWGFTQCPLCDREGSINDWARSYGLSPSYISKLLNGICQDMRLTQAQKILTAIGEPMPPHLKKYKPRRETVDDHKRKKAA